MAITWKNINTPGFGSVAQQNAIGTNTLNKNIGNLANIANTFQKRAVDAEAEALAAPQKAFDLNQQQLANQAILTRQQNLPARQNIENLIASGDLDGASAAIDEFEGADTTGFSQGIAAQQAGALARSNAVADRGFQAQARGRQATTFGNQQQDRNTRLTQEANTKAMNKNLADISSSGMTREEMQQAGKAVILQGGGSPSDLANFNRSLITTIDSEDANTGKEQAQIDNNNTLAAQQSAQRLKVAQDQYAKVQAANPLDPAVTADRAAVQITDVKTLARELSPQTSWWPGTKSASGLVSYIDKISDTRWIVDPKEGVRKATAAEKKAGKGVQAKAWMLKDALVTSTTTDEENNIFNPATNVKQFEATIGRLATDQTNKRRGNAIDVALEQLRKVQQSEAVTNASNRSSIPENIRRQ